MSNPTIQTSFAAGELSPTLFGRVDLAKYKVGAKTMRNFFVDYRGGATSRPGTEWAGQCRSGTNTTRLLPFKFSTLQTYVLEFGDQYMRVIKDGGYVLESAKTVTSITQANPGVVTSAGHGYAAGDWVYLSVLGMSQVNQQLYQIDNVTANTFTLKSTITGAAIDTTAFTAFVSGTVARVFELVTPYLSSDLGQLKYTQSADVMTLTHPSYAPRDLTRTGHASWTLSLVSFYTSIAAPGGLGVTSSGAGTTYFAYVVTSISETGEESVASSTGRVQGVNITTTSGSNTLTWNQVSGAAYYNVYRATVSPNVDIPEGATFGYVGMTYGVQFVDSNITPDYTKTPPRHSNPFAKSPISKITLTAGGAGYVATTTTCTITDPTGSGAIIVPVVVGGAIVATIILDGGHDYTAPVVTFGGAGAGAAGTATIGYATGTYPATSCYFQQRKMYAASANFPQTLWGSQPGAFSNMDKSIPTTDGDSLNLTISSTQVNDIKFMLPMPGGLVVLTGGGAWQITGTGQQNSAVTPSSAIAVPQAYNGCADLPPIVANYDILYVQAKGSIVRDLSYNFFTNIYTGIDISALSNHLFNPYRLTEWAYAEEPFKTIWAVRNDGKLLSLAFVKEQEVYGWARHDTQGQFKSVAVIQEGIEDVPYFIVRRKVQGFWVQFVERMASRILPEDVAPELSAEDAWCLDCALEYPRVYPSAGLTISAASGTVTVTADSGVFSVGDVGKVLRAGGGRGTVTGYTSATQVTVTLDVDIVQTIPDDPDLTPLPVASGAWTLQTKTTSVSGLNHLEGKTVWALADGSVVSDLVVTGGVVTLPSAASLITVGLRYTCDLETLNLELADGLGTIQGKRKKLTALTTRMFKTRGLAAGPTFSEVYELKLPVEAYAIPQALLTGDQRIVMSPSYNIEGRICIRQSYPLPATVLAVIPEIELGDGR